MRKNERYQMALRVKIYRKLRLISAGFENVSTDRAMHEFCTMELRLLVPKPRSVLVSKELTVPDIVKDDYKHFKEAVEQGENLLPYMTKSIIDVTFKDGMLFDWGMFHFHMSSDIDAKDSRFVKRSGFLLITYVDLNHDDRMYFLQIQPHKHNVWTKQELVRILVDNWPETMEKHRLNGVVSLTQNVTDQDYERLRNCNVSSVVDLHDGRVYLGANFGLNTAGTSVKSVMLHNRYANDAKWVEIAMGDTVEDIVETINKKIYAPEQHFKLKMITPGDGDYIFQVAGYDFLLRYVANKKGKSIIAVGDTEEQIDEKLQTLLELE